jgi:hypothetical protein
MIIMFKDEQSLYQAFYRYLDRDQSQLACLRTDNQDHQSS